MKEVLRDKLDNFSRAVARLEEALKAQGHALSLDGTVQRFEFTFEMAWKALRAGRLEGWKRLLAHLR